MCENEYAWVGAPNFANVIGVKLRVDFAVTCPGDNFDVGFSRYVGVEMALDGALTKAPLGGEKKRPQPLRPRQKRGQTRSADRGQGYGSRNKRGRSQLPGHETGAGHSGEHAVEHCG